MEETVAGGDIVSIVALAIAVVMVVSMWRILTKGGQPGWAILIPIYNAYVMLKIAGKPGWWLILLFVPVVNIVIGVMAVASLSANFGKGAGFVVGLIVLPSVFYPVLAFGRAQYQVAQA